MTVISSSMQLVSPENVTGFVDLGNWLNTNTGMNSVIVDPFGHILLFGFFLILFTVMKSSSQTPQAAAASMLLTFIIGILFSIFGWIPATTVAILFALTIASFIWLTFHTQW